MVAKNIFKDTFREIKNNKKKFISLSLIILIGVGFYVGLKSTSYDMLKTAKDYYKETNLMDIKLASMAGFSDNEVSTIKSIKNVDEVMGVKTTDANIKIDSKSYVIKAININKNIDTNSKDYINKLVLTKGKYPTTINEGLVEEKLLNDTSLKIGSLITLNPSNSSELRAKKIKIVGTVKNSYYSSKDRGTTTLGNGTVNYYIYLEENDFNKDNYDEIYVTVKKKDNLDTYSKEYENLVNNVKKEITDKTYSVSVDNYNANKIALEDDIKRIEEEINSIDKNDKENEEELSTLQDELKDNKNKLEKLKFPTNYSISRTESSFFNEYKLEAQRIDSISKIFPFIFFLVATLTSITAMSRMLDEKRTEIGTLLALGYSKIEVLLKYLLYVVLACLAGSILGSLIFYKLIPNIIANCYNLFYDMPKISTYLQVKHIIVIGLLSVLLTTVSTILVFYKDIISTPSALMIPKAPKKGKRIILEKLGFFNKLKYEDKITVRNIFRYKKRFFMTLFGIIGCSSLLLAAFGLKDSITSIVNKQFTKINKYDMTISISSNDKIDDYISKSNKIKDSIKISEETITAKNYKHNEQAYLIVPSNTKKINKFINTKKIDNEGVVISEKLATLLNVKKNDKFKILLSDNKYITVKVSNITENYINHYVYMSPTLYKKLTKIDATYNNILTINKKLSNKSENNLISDMTSYDNVIGVTSNKYVKKTYENMTTTLTYVTLVLIFAAGALAFVVLYNLSSVNISERKRELSTLKVLGFYDEEVSRYVNKESLILSIIGSLIGFVAGSFLSYYVIKSCETNILLFKFNISILSYLLSFLITLIFTLIVNSITHIDLKKLNMLDALKVSE